MLTGLAIRDVVLIERLDLAFGPGLTVLTGETGAGKSILLDSLGLALGARGDSGLVRPGAAKAVITASFDIPPDHAVLDDLIAQELLEAEDRGEPIMLRRQISADGRSRAFVNDQPVSISLLRKLGAGLAEIQGQFDQQGLLDPTGHLDLLDSHGGLMARRSALAALWRDWQEARKTWRQAQADAEQARADEDYLRFAVEELAALAPKPDEEQQLADLRATMMNAEKLIEALNMAAMLLGESEGEGGGLENRLTTALGHLYRVADKAGGRLDPVLNGLDAALAELREALLALHGVQQDLELDPGRLEQVEERLFALRALARKHGIEVGDLPVLQERLEAKLASIETGDTSLAALAQAAEAARSHYLKSAEALSRARTEAARALDAAVNAELPPLKLGKASFHTRIERAEENGWGPRGLDQVTFEVATNPGSAPGPLGRIASGGELSRFMLALKVVLSQADPVPTLVFDEVDSGIGGATAAAVGERLATLAEQLQVLVVTHSPQVAGRGQAHLHVAKQEQEGQTVTHVAPLESLTARQEEIARMISGASITNEARAAAIQLLGDSVKAG